MPLRRFESPGTTCSGCTRQRQAPQIPTCWACAQRERRVLVTFDKDFGELAFRIGAAAAFGVVLFRINAASPDLVARTAVATFADRTDWAGSFVVVEDQRLRIRSMPPPATR